MIIKGQFNLVFNFLGIKYNPEKRLGDLSLKFRVGWRMVENGVAYRG